MIRPGAASRPAAVWHELQSFSPAWRTVSILLVTPARETSALYGNRLVPGHRPRVKFPCVLEVSSTRIPSAPVIATVTFSTPEQFVSSCEAFITEPAIANDGPE
jgi:hypothetical protein